MPGSAASSVVKNDAHVLPSWYGTMLCPTRCCQAWHIKPPRMSPPLIMPPGFILAIADERGWAAADLPTPLPWPPPVTEQPEILPMTPEVAIAAPPAASTVLSMKVQPRIAPMIPVRPVRSPIRYLSSRSWSTTPLQMAPPGSVEVLLRKVHLRISPTVPRLTMLPPHAAPRR